MGERGIQLRVNACESEAMWACMSVCTGWWETGVAAGGVTLEPHPMVRRDTPSRVEEGCAASNTSPWHESHFEGVAFPGDFLSY